MTQKYSNNKKYINNNNNIIDKAKLSMMIMLAGLITFINNACEKEHIINDKTEQNNNNNGNNGNKPNPTPNPQPTPDKTISFEEALELIIDSTKTAQNNNLAKIKAEYEDRGIKDSLFILAWKDMDKLKTILFDNNARDYKATYRFENNSVSALLKESPDTNEGKIKTGMAYFGILKDNKHNPNKNAQKYYDKTKEYTLNDLALKNMDSVQNTTNDKKNIEYLQKTNKELINNIIKDFNNICCNDTKKSRYSYKKLFNSFLKNNPSIKDSIDAIMFTHLNYFIPDGKNGEGFFASTLEEYNNNLKEFNRCLDALAKLQITSQIEQKMRQKKR